MRYKWKPITSAPRDGTSILLLDEFCYVGRWRFHPPLDGYYWCDFKGELLFPTHWMHIPREYAKEKSHVR